MFLRAKVRRKQLNLQQLETNPSFGNRRFRGFFGNVQRSMTGQFSSNRSLPKRGNLAPLAGTTARAAREAAKTCAHGDDARWGKYMLLLERHVRFSRYAMHGSRFRQYPGHSKSLDTGGRGGALCQIDDVRNCP